MQPNIQTGNSTHLVNEKLKYAITARHHLAVSMNINNDSNIDNKFSVWAQRDASASFVFTRFSLELGDHKTATVAKTVKGMYIYISISIYVYIIVCLGLRGDSLHSKHYTQAKLDGSSCVERSVSTTPASAWLP